MAPVAAHLACGVDPKKLGYGQDSMLMLDWPEAKKSAGGVAGEVLYIDSFGNLITNIHHEDVTAIGEPTSLVVDCGGRKVRGIVATYAAALAGEVVALFDSQGRLEIAKVDGNAATELHIEPGEQVVVSHR
jgi:hypothetical protein